MSSWLTILSPPDLRGVTHDLRGDEVLLGRADDSGLRLPVSEVSRRHAMIRPAAGRSAAVLIDLGSRAGTMVNGRPITGAQKLSDGDVIRLASVELGYHQERDPFSWQRAWKLGSAGVVGAGAIAGAVLSIMSLWPAPDPQDVARISAVQVTSTRMPLSEYQQRSSTRPISGDVTVGAPAQMTALAGQLVAFHASQTTPTVTDGPAPTGDPTTTPPPAETGEDPSVLPTDEVAPSVKGPRGTPGAPPVATVDVTGVGTTQNRLVTDLLVQDALHQAEKERVISPGPDVTTYDKAYLLNVQGTDGKPLPATEAVDHLVKVLKDARRTVTSDVGGKRVKRLSEPLGVVVRADVEMAGMRKKVVTLSWSMWEGDGATQLQGEWLNENLAYRLVPSTDHDTASLDLWVPLPKDHGPYIIRTTLAVNRTEVASANTDPFM